jgi:hypothetical protein
VLSRADVVGGFVLLVYRDAVRAVVRGDVRLLVVE